MKRKKIQYKKLEALMPIARRLAKISNYKFICAVLCIIENDCKWMNMKFSRLSKNGITAKSIAFFLENPILEAIKKTQII